MKQQNSNPYLHPVGFPSAAPNPYQTQPPSFSPQPPPSASALFPASQQGAALPSPSPSPVGAAPYRAHSFNYQQQPQQQPAYQTQQQQQQMYYQQQQQHAYQQAAAHGVPASYYQQGAQLAPAPVQGNAMRVSAGYIPTYQQPNPAAYQQPPQQPPQQQQQVFVQQGSQGNVYQPPPYQAVVQQQQQHQQNNHWDIQFSELQLGKELGRGAFGIVYKGRWRLTDVAVKS